MKHCFLFASAMALSMAGNLISAQAPSPSVAGSQIVMHRLTPTVYWSEGGVSNSGIIIGDSGVIVVDAKMTPDASKEMLGEIARITPKPVVAVILTHSDGDHIGGLSALPEGIQIIAHQNCVTEMQEPESQPGGAQPGQQQGAQPGNAQSGPQRGQASPQAGQGTPAVKRMPNKIVSGNREEMTIAGVHLVLLHWVPAHTTGDMVVDLPDRKIVFTGDLLTENPTPLIHREKNGSTEGWIESANALAELNAEVYVPGHGNVTDTASIRALVAKFSANREKIKRMVAQGKSLAEIKAVLNDPVAVAGQGHPAFPTFTDVAYAELTSQKSN